MPPKRRRKQHSLWPAVSPSVRPARPSRPGMWCGKQTTGRRADRVRCLVRRRGAMTHQLCNRVVSCNACMLCARMHYMCRHQRTDDAAYAICMHFGVLSKYVGAVINTCDSQCVWLVSVVFWHDVAGENVSLRCTHLLCIYA